MNKTRQIIKYLLSDHLSATFAWLCFFGYRKIYIEPLKYGYSIPVEFSANFYWGLLLIPIWWVFLYSITGSYSNIYRKSRLKEIVQTFTQSLIGVTILFFVVMLDDEVASYKNYYYSFTTLFSVHFLLTVIGRFILTSITKYQIKKRKIGFNTLIVGNNARALKLFKELEQGENNVGFKFIGFINGIENNTEFLGKHLPQLGLYKEVLAIVEKNNVEDVIIAIESSEHQHLKEIIGELEDTKVDIKVMPDMYDIMTGSVKMNHLFGIPLIQIKTDLMPIWQQYVKRWMDVVFSLLFILIFSPVFIFLALGVAFSSKGPIIYRQKRIGLHGKPFYIFKFRSMYLNAEQGGPALATENDQRITKFGKFMRKTRLDEFPQFFNVIIGDMSLVGPRPERQFYIDQIVEFAPHYKHLHKVRPGITSWGQVKYGYAENVEEMVERLKYDLIYIENMSLAIDLKIMFYTVVTMVMGKGQ